MLRIESLAGDGAKSLERIASGEAVDAALSACPEGEVRDTLAALFGAAGSMAPPASGASIGEFEVAEVLSGADRPLCVRTKDPFYDGIETREIALKQLPKADSKTRAKQFLTQTQVAAAGSESVAEILGFHVEGEGADGVPFLVRRFVPGVSLAAIYEKLQEEEVPPDSPTWRLAAGARGGGANVIGAKIVCRIGQFSSKALADVHAKGAIHGGLHPGNLICDDTVRPTVVDFGISPAAAPHEAPEVITASDRPAARNHLSDLYVLGVILYHGLTRVPIFGEGTTEEIEARSLKAKPDHPTKHNFKASKEMSTITLGLLEKDPNKRFKDAAELAEDLDRYHKNDKIKRKAPSLMGRLFG